MKTLFKLLLLLLSLWAIVRFTEVDERIRDFFSDFWGKSEADSLAISDLEKAKKIDVFFSSINAPMAGQGREFIRVANLFQLDWRLLPAICRVESTGGKNPYNGDRHNVLGYKVKRDLKDYRDAIESAGRVLAGKGKRTHAIYSGKTLRQRLHIYSGGEAGYADTVFAYMKKIH